MMKNILLSLVEKMTGPRYAPDIQWSAGSWTHTVFRCWEWLAGRKIGIRAEMSVTWKRDWDGFHAMYACHSFESLCALFEQCVRQWFFGFRIIPIRVWIPALHIGGNIPFSGAPFLLAIALDTNTTSAASSSSPVTWTHTVTGSNPLIALGGVSGGTAGGTQPTFTAASYNSISATEAKAQQGGNTVLVEASVWLLGSASIGSNTASMTATLGSSPAIAGNSTSYSGAQSGSIADATGGVSGATTGDKTFIVTTVANNCWVYAVGCNFAQISPTLVADQTNRGTVSLTALYPGLLRAEDTNAAVAPAGNKTMGMTVGAGVNEGGFGIAGASFAPAAAVAAAPTDSTPPPFIGGVASDEGAFGI